MQKTLLKLKLFITSILQVLKIPLLVKAIRSVFRRVTDSLLFKTFANFIKTTASFIFRLLSTAGYRLVFFMPLIQCTHLPAIVPTSWIVAYRIPSLLVFFYFAGFFVTVVFQYRKQTPVDGKPPARAKFIFLGLLTFLVMLIVICAPSGASFLGLVLFFIAFRTFSDVLYLPPGFYSQLVFYVLAAFTIVLWYPMFYIVHVVFPWLMPVIIAAWLIVLRKKAAAGSLDFYPFIARWLFTPLCFAFLITVFIFSYTTRCDETHHPAITYYINYCDETDELIPREKLREKLSDEEFAVIMKMFRLCYELDGRVFISATEDASLVYDPSDESIRVFRPSSGFFSIVENSENNTVFTAHSKERHLRIYDLDTMNVVQDFDLSGVGTPYWLDMDPASRRVFVSFSETNKNKADHAHAMIYDIDSGKLLKSTILRDQDGGVAEADIDRENGIVYLVMVFNSSSGNYVAAYDIRNLNLLRTRNIPWFAMGITYDPDRSAVFLLTGITGPGNATLAEWDAETFESISEMKVPNGARDVVKGTDGFYYVSNYVYGNIYRIDWDKKEIVDSIQVGRKIKRMEYSRDMNALFFTSERGYARLDLDKWPVKNSD